jgi:hypothetical protein
VTAGRYTKPVETANLRLFREGVKAIENRTAPEAAFVVIKGHPGYGKTHAGLAYSIANSIPFVRIQAAATPHWVLSDWVTELGERPAHSCEALHNQLVELLAKKPRAVIFDEVEHALSNGKVIDSIRGVVDTVEIPCVFMGREYIDQRLKRHAAVWSRVSAKVTFKPLDAADMAKLVEERGGVKADADLIERLIRDSEGRIRLALGAVDEIRRYASRAGVKIVRAVDLAKRELVKADSAQAREQAAASPVENA